MGYDAFVICTCYQEGKTTEPPHKEFLRFDQEGLHLDVPSELWDQNKEIVLQMHAAFNKWLATACKHKDMRQISQRLANITDMAWFRQIIEILGGSTAYPTLTQYLPNTNCGILPSSAAQQALDELFLLENEQSTEKIITLSEISTNRTIFSINAEDHEVLAYTNYNGKKQTYGLSKNGFYIGEHGQSAYSVMFQSKDFIQKPVSKGYLFIDIPSGRNFTAVKEIYPYSENPKKDYKFKVKAKRVLVADRYQFLISSLKQLAKVSIASGNPVHWS